MSALAWLAACGPGAAADTFRLKSPAGNVDLTVTHEEGSGRLTYRVRSAGTLVLEDGALGITTSRGDFTEGLTFARKVERMVSETYRLPVGKRSST
jgi:alpha-glucosidase